MTNAYEFQQMLAGYISFAMDGDETNDGVIKNAEMIADVALDAMHGEFADATSSEYASRILSLESSTKLAIAMAEHALAFETEGA